jgi:hypothetical protein
MILLRRGPTGGVRRPRILTEGNVARFIENPNHATGCETSRNEVEVNLATSNARLAT